MNNIVGIGIIQIGNEKRVAVTYQTADENGKITASNQKMNRIITNTDVLNASKILNDYCQCLIDGTEYKAETSTDTTSTSTATA